jgi:N-acetylglucosaminyl-diphospho-decaprenol L-rhamnosyltransferase
VANSSSRERLGVVVVNYNSSSLLKTHLATSAFPDGCMVTVVENSVEPGEKQVVRALAALHGWDLVDAGSNVGFGRAMNLGADHALSRGCSALLVLNPDAWIEEVELLKLLDRHAANPAAMISPRINRADGSSWFTGAVILPTAGRAVHRPVGDRSDWISAACLLVPAEAWTQLGGMDRDYFLYWEDVDLTYRWKQSGGSLLVAEDATATHSVGGTQSLGIGKSTTYLYYNCRNRLLFAAKNMGTARTALWLLTTPDYWVHMLRQARIKHSEEKVKALSAILRGTLAGIAAAMLNPKRASVHHTSKPNEA